MRLYEYKDLVKSLVTDVKRGKNISFLLGSAVSYENGRGCPNVSVMLNIIKEYFKEYDAMIMPVGVGAAKHIDGSLDMIDENTSVLDEFLQVGNFGGFPSITIPDGFIDNLPVGVNITGNCYDDQNVLNIAYALESVMPYKNQIAKEVNHE